MRKWEEKYKELEDGKKLDEQISVLTDKKDKRAITREELKELDKLERIKENLPKVKNILEYKNKLEAELKDLKEEQKRRQTLAKTDKANEKLEEEMNKLTEERAKLEAELKTADNDDKKKEIQGKLKQVQEKRDANNKAFAENQETLAKNAKGKEALKRIPDDKLSAKITNMSTKISKCNMICNNLLQGKSWDSIDLKLEQWQDREFKSDKKTADKMRESAEEGKEESKEKEESKKEEAKEGEGSVKEEGTKKEESKEDRKLSEEDKEMEEHIGKEVSRIMKEQKEGKETSLVASFEEMYPRLSKIPLLKRFAKARYDKMVADLNIKESEEDKEKPEKEDGEKDKKEKDEVGKAEKDDFREYIKVVAEKGMKTADKERLSQKLKATQEKIASQPQPQPKQEKTDTGREPGDD